MPGAKGNRTKGNVKPSSSSRAAELLSQSGAVATGFIGFGAQAYVPASQTFDDEDNSLDSDFRVVLRKLTKRDATTKVKALGEFSVLCKEKDEATLLAVLPYWPRLFNRLALDVDAKVREATQNAMTTLVSRVHRNLAPYLKSIMGAWILSRNDPYPTVSSAAHKSFRAAFPPNKQEGAIVFCKQPIIEYLTDNLMNQTAATLSDPKTTEKEEREGKLVRVQCSSLMGLRQVLLALPAGQLDDRLVGLLKGLLDHASFWTLTKSSQPLVRSGLFWFVASLCQAVPAVSQEYVHKFSPLVLGSIDTTEPGLTSAVWDAILSLVKFVPACWEKINFQKAFWPKLKKQLEGGCQGNAASVAPNLLPLVACIPLEMAGGSAAFFPKLLDSFKQGLANDSVVNSVSEASAFTKAFVECIQFSVKIIGTDSAAQSLCKTIILDHLLMVVEASLCDPKPTLSRSQLYSCVSAFFRTMENNPDQAPLLAAFWFQLSDDLVALFELAEPKKQLGLHTERLVAFVKAILFAHDSASSALPVSDKLERVRFLDSAATKFSPLSTAPARAGELSPEAKSFVQKMFAHSYQLYRQDKSHSHFKLFVDLANLYFSADMALYVLKSLDDTELDQDKQPADREDNSCPHSQVIQRVVLPVLAEKGGRQDAEMTDHTITFLFACLPYLSQDGSTKVWDRVLQTVNDAGALGCLIERALEKRHIMPQVFQWLSSEHLHKRLLEILRTVTTQHFTLDSSELEQGWKVICCVLSANDDKEPVFPSTWIADVVSSVHRELVSLGSQAQSTTDVQAAIQFVSKAAVTFFQNLRMSLSLQEGREVITALMMADLDIGFSASEVVVRALRQSWALGLGLVVAGTGGLIHTGGVLASACALVRNTLLNQTRTFDQYHRVVAVTEELLKTAQQHLPVDDGDTSGQSCNPVLRAVLSELVMQPSLSTDSYREIIKHLCLSGNLALTELEKAATLVTEGDNSASMPMVVFSSLFNLRLCSILRSGFRLDDMEAEGARVELEQQDKAQEEEEHKRNVVEESEEDKEKRSLVEEILLSAVRASLMADIWLKLQSQVSPDVISAIEDLSKETKSSISSSSWNVLKNIMLKALCRMPEDALNFVMVGHLAKILLSQSGNVPVKQFLLQAFSDKLDTSEVCEEMLVLYLHPQKLTEQFDLQASIFASITDDSLPSAFSSLRIMSQCLLNGSYEFMIESRETILNILSQLKTMRDNYSSLFLFSCDISDEPVWRLDFNMATMQFFTATVQHKDCSLTPEMWDFLLCSAVSWMESVDSSGMSLASAVNLQAFSVELCRLLVTVAHTIQQLLPHSRECYPANLETEWKEFFADGIYTFLFPLFVRLTEESKSSERRGAAEVVLRAVGSAMCQCPQEQITGHHLPLNLQASDDTSPIPHWLQTLLNSLGPALLSSLAPVQLTAFTLLDRVITLLPGYHSEQEDNEGAASDKAKEPRPPPSSLMKLIDDCGMAMDEVLSKVPMETTVVMAPGSEEYQFALAYLLAWRLMLRLFHSAQSQIRAEYALYLKEHCSVERLLSHLFRLMPVTPASTFSAASPNKLSLSPSFRQNLSLTEAEVGGGDSWFDSSFVPLKADSIGLEKDIQLLSCCLYTHCLQVIPVLVRQWWKDQDRKSAAFVEKFTTKYVSPHLIRSEIQAVNKSGSDIKDIVVKASSISRQVTASYVTEELKAEIEITLPESYPLGEISVQAQRHAVVRQAQWERLLLQLNVFLQHQNGSIMEGLWLWKRNIDKRLEGVEECFICYAVIHASSYNLPRVPCRTCKKKFHSECLYKWLNSSQNSTCPLCRSLF